jgi:hypothetical protein
VSKLVYYSGRLKNFFFKKGTILVSTIDDDGMSDQGEAIIDTTWMDDELRDLDEQYRRYMDARQKLSRFSNRTLKRYRPAHLRKAKFNKAEDEFLHRLVAAHYTYQSQFILCSKGNAHFAAALMGVSATECLLLAAFLQLKEQVSATPRV